MLVLTGCGAPDDAVTQANAGGLEVAQVAPSPPDAGQSSAAGIERVRGLPRNEYAWTVPSLDPASAAVRLDWVDGSTLECGEADRVAVRETDDAVVIGIAATHADGSIACSLSGTLRTLTVHLRRPLGSRALLQPASGTNDGLPRTSDAAVLPEPRCTTDVARDVPIGMLDATHRLAPLGAVRALVCRTIWPKGRVRTDELRIDDPARVEALVRRFDEVRDLHPASDPPAPCRRTRGAWYSVHLEGKGVRVQVRADEIDCGVATNGAVTGTMTSGLVRALDALFAR